MPAHHAVEKYSDEYIKATGFTGNKNEPLFRTTHGRSWVLTERALNRFDAYQIIKRRAKNANVWLEIRCYTFRVTGITEQMRSGGTVKKATQIAPHENTRTTQLYNRTDDELNLDETKRILI